MRDHHRNLGGDAAAAVLELGHRHVEGLHGNEAAAAHEKQRRDQVDGLLPRALQVLRQDVHLQVVAVPGHEDDAGVDEADHGEDQHFLGPEERRQEDIAGDHIGAGDGDDKQNQDAHDDAERGEDGALDPLRPVARARCLAHTLLFPVGPRPGFESGFQPGRLPTLMWRIAAGILLNTTGTDEPLQPDARNLGNPNARTADRQTHRWAVSPALTESLSLCIAELA